jgi:hypothetical protein
MPTTRVATTLATRIPFMSTCPKCGRERATWYSHSGLLRLLHRGYPIEGYCIYCDDYWRISAREREGLATKLTN